MQTHSLQRNTPRQTKKRVGRGGVRGKTSGRGHKGQGQHGGHGIRPAIRDFIKKLPKLRGHGINRGRTVNSGKEIAQHVSLSAIDAAFEAKSKVTPKTLAEKGLVRTVGAKNPLVKILANGEITKAVTVIGCSVSSGAREQIESKGGIIK